ncbi:unnamed protein product [Owenia fusiformis]|uniref:Uncharacterized protein n=2 Tax=Owenia fusiformis TaxID=6347 RepID=A0A8J1Y5F6_OWEFU|nr:unnamed protein product [Owenia fusiformis]
MAAASGSCEFSAVGCEEDANDTEIHKEESTVHHFKLLHQAQKELHKICELITPEQMKSMTESMTHFSQLLLTMEIHVGTGHRNSNESQHALKSMLDISDLTDYKISIFMNVLDVLQQESTWVKQRLANLETGIQRHFFQVLKNLFVQHQRTDKFITQQQVAIANLDIAIDESQITVYDGKMILPIDNFQERFKKAKIRDPASVTSPAFYTRRGGYKLKVRVYLHGDGMGLGTHVSIFIMMCKGKFDALLPWPFNQKITLGILNQLDRSEDYMDTFKPNKALNTWGKPVSDTNVPTGIPKFLDLGRVLDPSQGFVNEDTLFVKVSIEQEPRTPLSAFLGYKEIEEQ